MTPYIQREVFRAFEQTVFARATKAVRNVGPGWGNELRCHELARAIYRFLDIGSMRVVDGKVGSCEHTWLEMAVPIAEAEKDIDPYKERREPAEGEWKYRRRVILDVYTPGRLPQVQLIDPFPLLEPAYKEGPVRTDIRYEIVDEVFKQIRDLAVYGAVR